MTNTQIVPRRADRADREPPDRPPLVDAALADELPARAQSQRVELLGPDGLLSQVTTAVLERALGQQMSQHLGYDKHDPAGRGSGNSRNRSSGKRLLTDIGRNRPGRTARPQRQLRPTNRAQGSDPPGRVQRRHHRLYARGLSTCDIRAHLREMYDVDVSPDLISRVTDAVLEELQESQTRPLDRVYPVVFVDALMVKIRDGVGREPAGVSGDRDRL
jgi:putative transposase